MLGQLNVFDLYLLTGAIGHINHPSMGQRSGAGKGRAGIGKRRVEGAVQGRFNWSADQDPFIFPLNCGQRLDTDRPIEIDTFGWSEQLVWPSN